MTQEKKEFIAKWVNLGGIYDCRTNTFSLYDLDNINYNEAKIIAGTGQNCRHPFMRKNSQYPFMYKY